MKMDLYLWSYPSIIELLNQLRVSSVYLVSTYVCPMSS